MLALYKLVIVLREMHAYLMVAEAVDSRNKESLKRKEKNTFEVTHVCMMSFHKINTHSLGRNIPLFQQHVIV